MNNGRCGKATSGGGGIKKEEKTSD